MASIRPGRDHATIGGEAAHSDPQRSVRLADVLYGQILKQIVSGNYVRGEKLPSENEICAAFGVSRPVVREALQRLRADGLVFARQGAGTFVSTQPPENLINVMPPSAIAGVLRIFEVRIALEPECARLAATRRTKADILAMEAAMEKQEQAFAAGRDGLSEDFAFHAAIADAAGNVTFRTVLDVLAEDIRTFMLTTLSMTKVGSSERKQTVLGEHAQILQAIKSYHAENAALFMKYHLVQARVRMTDMRRDH